MEVKDKKEFISMCTLSYYGSENIKFCNLLPLFFTTMGIQSSFISLSKLIMYALS